MIKYGKPVADVLGHKGAFFSANKTNLEHSRAMFELYTKQPKRTRCKNCAGPLGAACFKKSGVDYVQCGKCSHLNGAHEDTNEFCAKLYTEDQGKSYAKGYSAETRNDYKKRVKDIYSPKAEFLMASLAELGHDPRQLRYADLGAGSGYFVAALKDQGLSEVNGYEVSASQVELANDMIGAQLLHKHELSELVQIVDGLKAEVVSMIGVLEHVQNPREILKAISGNKGIKYLFFSVPLFSPCVFFEALCSDNVSPRHLAPPHTHLYTEASINHFCKEFGMERKSEWWFGSDMMDLYRNTWVTLKEKGNHGASMEIWDSMFRGLIDELQMAQDKLKASSEVHMLLKVN